MIILILLIVIRYNVDLDRIKRSVGAGVANTHNNHIIIIIKHTRLYHDIFNIQYYNVILHYPRAVVVSAMCRRRFTTPITPLSIQ